MHLSVDDEMCKSPFLSSSTLNSPAVWTHIRRLGFDDKPDYQAMLRSLDQPSRCSRFGHAASDSALTVHAANTLGLASAVLGAYAGSELRGAIELHFDGNRVCAEAAIVVDGPWRRRGVGWALLRAGMDWAADNQAKMIEMIIHRHNWPMRFLASKARAKLDLSFDQLKAEILVRNS